MDFNFQVTPTFRDLSPSSLLLLRQPLVRSLAKLERLRRGRPVVPEGPGLRSARAFSAR